MITRARIRPSSRRKRAKTLRGGASPQDVSAGRFPKSSGQKTAGTRETSVHTHIRTFGIYLNPNTRTSIRRKLDSKFRKFARSIERMSVRLEDVNGPRGGVDHLCRIKVVLRNLPSVVYERQDVSVDAAVGGALAGAERAVRKTLQRIHEAPIKKRRQLIA
jgi:sigma 54 modulation/S30EA-like ribosomal protein